MTDDPEDTAATPAPRTERMARTESVVPGAAGPGAGDRDAARPASEPAEERHSALVGFMSVPVHPRFPIRRSTLLLVLAFLGFATLLYFNPPASTSTVVLHTPSGDYEIPGATKLPASATTTTTTTTTRPPTPTTTTTTTTYPSATTTYPSTTTTTRGGPATTSTTVRGTVGTSGTTTTTIAPGRSATSSAPTP